MAQDSKTPSGDDAIRDVIRKTVAANGSVPVDSLKDRYDTSGVPHIKMGQLRELIAKNMKGLQQELAAAKEALLKAQNDTQSQLDKQAAEFEKRLELEKEKAAAAAASASAERELAAANDRIAQLEETLAKERGEWEGEKGRLESENTKLNGIVASIDMSSNAEFIQKIKELEEQLQAARDALAEANAEIQRLLAELRYAEPIIQPDHPALSSAVNKVRGMTSGLGVDADRSVSRVLDYVRHNEELCQAELPKLLERMNGLEASFPQVARMVKLATLHEENRRWLSVLDSVLSN